MQLRKFFDKKWKVVVVVFLGLAFLGALVGEDEPKEAKVEVVDKDLAEEKAEPVEEKVVALFDVRDLAGKTQEEMDHIVGIPSTINSDGNYIYDLEDYELEVSEVDFENWFTMIPKTEKRTDDWKEIFQTFGLPTNKPGKENTMLGGLDWTDYQTVDGTEGALLSTKGTVQEASDEVNYLLVKVEK